MMDRMTATVTICRFRCSVLSMLAVVSVLSCSIVVMSDTPAAASKPNPAKQQARAIAISAQGLSGFRRGGTLAREVRPPGVSRRSRAQIIGLCIWRTFGDRDQSRWPNCPDGERCRQLDPGTNCIPQWPASRVARCLHRTHQALGNAAAAQRQRPGCGSHSAYQWHAEKGCLPDRVRAQSARRLFSVG